MKKKVLTNSLSCLIIGFLLMSFPALSEARRFGGGGFGRSFGRSFGSGGFRRGGRTGRRSRPSKSLGTGGWGRGRSKSDRGLSRKTAQKGKQFTSRSAAEKAYKSKHQFKNKFSSKPSRRPNSIPQSVSRGGRNYNVAYNNGSYGYFNPLGVFVALAATDMLVTNAMLRSGGYGYGYGQYRDPYYYRSGGMSFYSGFLMFILILYIASLIKKSKYQG